MISTPTYATAFAKFFTRTVRKLAFAGNPVLSSIKTFEMPYESSFGTQVPSGLVTTPLGVSELTGTIEIREVLETNIEAMQTLIIDASEQLVISIIPDVYDTMSRVCNASGNTTDVKASELTNDHLLDAYEKIQIDFDESGKPFKIELHINPIDAERLAKSEWTDGHQDRFEKIIKKKYEEFLARKRHRKLH